MISLIQDTLKKYNKKIWVMYNDENSDKLFCKYFTKHLATNTICIITTEKIYIIVSSLDKNNISKLNYDKKKVKFFVYSNLDELNNIIEDIIANLDFCNEICLRY